MLIALMSLRVAENPRKKCSIARSQSCNIDNSSNDQVEHTGLDSINLTAGHCSCNSVFSKGHHISSPAAGGYLPGHPPVSPPN